MYSRVRLILLKTMFLILLQQQAQAQYLPYALQVMDSLCSPRHAGRGYINDGVNTAAQYLAQEYKNIGLQSFGNNYFQPYNFDINTYPTPITCLADGQALEAGYHFLIEPSSPSFNGKVQLLPFDISNPSDKQLLFIKLAQGLLPNETILFKNNTDNRATNKLIDSLTNKLGYQLPLIVKSSNKKLLWTTSQKVGKLPEIIFPDTIINGVRELELSFTNKLIPNYNCKNIIGYLPSKKKQAKQEYIVITAHYDHLGMLGDKAYFPGASDNASGVSMLLNIAKQLSQQKLQTPVIFILFSGEEVGLLGSKYFVEHPLISLNKIKMLVNVDIMGSAEAGITVVNGEVYKNIFDELVAINNNKKYLPEIKIRGKAANSDHYFFSESGVPSIFIFSNGGPGYYHDVWDKPNTLTLTNYDNIAKLLLELINKQNH
jgi:aminopeptidase YwaD